MDWTSKKEHFKEHKAERKFKCSDCRRNFIDIYALQSHRCRGFSDNPKPFKCKECGKTFRQKSELQNHLPIHSDVKQFSCDLCGKQYTQKATLWRHEQVHKTIVSVDGDKTGQCKVCGKVFGDASSLRIHQRAQTGEKLYECKHCGKCFAQTSTLVGHLRTHSDNPGWKIIGCPRLPCMVNFPLGTATEGHQRNTTRTVSRSPSVPVTSTIASGLHLPQTVTPGDAPSTVLFLLSRIPVRSPSRKNERGGRTVQLRHQTPVKHPSATSATEPADLASALSAPVDVDHHLHDLRSNPSHDDDETEGTNAELGLV